MTEKTVNPFFKYHFAKNEGSKKLTRDMVLDDVEDAFRKEPVLARVVCTDCLEAESQELVAEVLDVLFYSGSDNRGELMPEETQRVMEMKMKVIKSGTLDLSDEDLCFVFGNLKAFEIILIAMAERRLDNINDDELNEWTKGVREIYSQLVKEVMSEYE